MILGPEDLEGGLLHEIRGRNTPVSLERALLVLSGLGTDHRIRSYMLRIDSIFQRFLDKCTGRGLFDSSPPPPYLHRRIARSLFDYLWTSKPKRFGEHFLLADVVDAQLDPHIDTLVGTCVGLTSLYSVLGLRAGLSLTLLATPDHLLSRLRIGPQAVDIDHTDPQGFDCRTSGDSRELPLLSLTACVLNRRGLRHQANGRMALARADYEKAILIDPEYANALNNRGNAKWLGDEDAEGAIADYTEAIRLNPSFCEAYCNRGMARQRLGLHEEARRDYDLAIRCNPEYVDAHMCLHILDDIER